MVCHGPDPPDNCPHELTPPSRPDLLMNGPQADESDEEQNEHFGYEALPQGPDAVPSDHDSDQEIDNAESNQQAAPSDVPPIEPIDIVLTREVWNSPRPTDPIQMDTERAQQVMSIMANFRLPDSAIPDWAQSISEEQWKQTLNDRIEILKANSNVTDIYKIE